ncbi:hypothetical protein Hanom_Chr02g00167161 [Helianthus anomalus]
MFVKAQTLQLIKIERKPFRRVYILSLCPALVPHIFHIVQHVTNIRPCTIWISDLENKNLHYSAPRAHLIPYN